MDSRVKLLKDFYSTMQPGKLKLETNNHGFDFLEQLLSDGIILEYGQLASYGLTHKYKLLNVPETVMDRFLQNHINKKCNVCFYFDEIANNTFCFNLDNNYKSNNTVLIPEMQFSVKTVMQRLEALGIEPLVIASGRGYHVWCRVADAIENQILADFMLRILAETMAELHKNGYDYQKVKINMYPNCKDNNKQSLRLFGTEHLKNKVFGCIYTKSGLLNEDKSWEYFADYLKNKTLSQEQFMQAYNHLVASFSAENNVPIIKLV